MLGLKLNHVSKRGHSRNVCDIINFYDRETNNSQQSLTEGEDYGSYL